MKDETRNVVVGITALAGVAGLALLLVLFGYLPRMLEPGYTVHVALEHSGGLARGNRVRLSGIDIGRISGIDLAKSPQTGVVAVLQIRGEIAIPRDVQVTVVSPSLTGSPSLAFDTSHLKPEQLATTLPTDGSASLEGEVPELVREFAGELRVALRSSVDAIAEALQKPMAQLDRLEQNFNELSQQWSSVGQNINQMIEDRSPEDVDAGQAQANLTTVLKRTDRRLAELKQTLAEARRWVERVGTATDKIGAVADKVGHTADTATANVEQLTRRYVALADDLSGTIADVRQLAEQARTGRGAVGKLLNDPALYDNLNDTAERLGQAADEIKLLIEKWKAEGVPVQF